MSENYSEKLKTAMAEIRAVADKHDIGAYVLLHEPGFSEFFLKIDPSWSALSLEEQDGRAGVRIRAKAEDFDGDKEKQRQVVADSCNMISHFHYATYNHHEIFDRLLKLIEEKMEVQHSDTVFTPNREN